MSVVETPVPSIVAPAAGFAARVDDWLERVGDRFNPIVVKECRQALKSRQFFAGFVLTLGACWIWSLAMTADGDPSGRQGVRILCGYFAILGFPLFVIVPFGAFRSLNLERDDKTFELLAVTTLRPSQIVLGKFVGAVVQVVLYVSATLPCFAFTGLLRGIDLPMMFYGLFYWIAHSLAFACLGLMLGGLVRERFMQMPATVVLLAAAFGVFILSINIADEFSIAGISRMMLDREFGAGNFGYVLAMLTSSILFLTVATTQVTFDGDNRSTGPRIAAFAQFLCFLGWMTYFTWSMSQFDYVRDWIYRESCEMTVILSVLYWYAIGIFLTGEPERLSQRVKRALPESAAGGALLGAFYPGPGRGLLFAVGNVGAVCALVLIVNRLLPLPYNNFRQQSGSFGLFVVATWAYFTIYLGLGALAIRYLQLLIATNFILRVLIHLGVFFGSLLFSMLIADRSYGWNSPDVTLATLMNPFIALQNILRYSTYEVGAYVVIGAAVLMLLAHLPGLISEFRQERVSAPERVLAEKLAAQKPVVAGPTNPWDQPDDG
ncbi:MAG: ABC transporter permease [Pirellulales bacterium]